MREKGKIDPTSNTSLLRMSFSNASAENMKKYLDEEDLENQSIHNSFFSKKGGRSTGENENGSESEGENDANNLHTSSNSSSTTPRHSFVVNNSNKNAENDYLSLSEETVHIDSSQPPQPQQQHHAMKKDRKDRFSIRTALSFEVPEPVIIPERLETDFCDASAFSNRSSSQLTSPSSVASMGSSSSSPPHHHHSRNNSNMSNLSMDTINNMNDNNSSSNYHYNLSRSVEDPEEQSHGSQVKTLQRLGRSFLIQNNIKQPEKTKTNLSNLKISLLPPLVEQNSSSNSSSANSSPLARHSSQPTMNAQKQQQHCQLVSRYHSSPIVTMNLAATPPQKDAVEDDNVSVSQLSVAELKV
jgi:hypothetical protein